MGTHLTSSDYSLYYLSGGLHSSPIHPYHALANYLIIGSNPWAPHHEPCDASHTLDLFGGTALGNTSSLSLSNTTTICHTSNLSSTDLNPTSGCSLVHSSSGVPQNGVVPGDTTQVTYSYSHHDPVCCSSDNSVSVSQKMHGDVSTEAYDPQRSYHEPCGIGYTLDPFRGTALDNTSSLSNSTTMFHHDSLSATDLNPTLDMFSSLWGLQNNAAPKLAGYWSGNSAPTFSQIHRRDSAIGSNHQAPYNDLDHSLGWQPCIQSFRGTFQGSTASLSSNSIELHSNNFTSTTTHCASPAYSQAYGVQSSPHNNTILGNPQPVTCLTADGSTPAWELCANTCTAVCEWMCGHHRCDEYIKVNRRDIT